MNNYTSFQQLPGATGDFDTRLQSEMAVFNMSPSGWKAAVNKSLPPSKDGYHFEALRQDNGRREIVGCAIGDSPDKAFFVADASPDPILDDTTAKRIAEGLNIKYSSDAVREARFKGDYR